MLYHVAIKVGTELGGVRTLSALEHGGVLVGVLFLVGVELDLAVCLEAAQVAVEEASVDVASLQVTQHLVLALGREQTQLAFKQLPFSAATVCAGEQTGQAGIRHL